MSKRFRPYEGSEPYIFVSYSHSDSDSVFTAAYSLYEASYRVWYDEGIPAGDDWPLNIENHLRASDTVLFFASRQSLASSNCLSEIRTAHRMGKSILCAGDEALLSVLCDGSADTEGLVTANVSAWRECLSNAKKLILSYDAGISDTVLAAFLPSEYLKGEYQTVEQQKAGRNLVSIIVLALSFTFLIGVTVGTWALLTGHLPQIWTPPAAISETEPEPTPVPTIDPSLFAGLIKNNIEFPDALQERAVRSITGISTGDVARENLAKVSSLYLCGNLFASEPSAITYGSGWLVNGVKTSDGSVTDMSLITNMYALEELYIVNENIDSINSLSDLPVLRSLSVAGNPIHSLDGIEGFSALYSLNISHSEIKNLEPLSALPSLREVYVSGDMLPLVMDSEARFEVILVK